MENVDALIEILEVAIRIENQQIAKEAVIALAKAYGLMPNIPIPTRIEDIVIYTPLIRENRIRAVKEMFERSKEYGLAVGLKEAKEEIDRRYSLNPKEGYFG